MDGSNPDPLTHKKHQAMLDRLSTLHQTRRQSKPESTPFESVASFLFLFSSSKQSIQSDLTRLLSSSDPQPQPESTIKPALDLISTSISDLDQTLAQNSYFLPSYDVRSCLKSISDLKDSLDKATSHLIPRKRFSFKNKSSSKKDPAELFIPFHEEPEIKVVSKEVKGSPGLRSKKGEILVKHFRGLDEGRGDFSLTDLDSCQVYLKGKIRALFINRISNCKIFCGPVLGSVLIEGVSGCLFVLASHQIRIHEARETDFYLRVRSRPIVEDSSGVRFGPYRLVYDGIEGELRDSGLGEETGLWANVDDFKWLRAVQSSNWCVIGEEEWMGVVDASDLEESCNGRKFESHCVEPGDKKKRFSEVLK